MARHSVRIQCYAGAKVKKACNKCDQKELCDREVKELVERLDTEFIERKEAEG
jgi:hypothetical protein